MLHVLLICILAGIAVVFWREIIDLALVGVIAIAAVWVFLVALSGVASTVAGYKPAAPVERPAAAPRAGATPDAGGSSCETWGDVTKCDGMGFVRLEVGGRSVQYRRNGEICVTADGGRTCVPAEGLRHVGTLVCADAAGLSGCRGVGYIALRDNAATYAVLTDDRGVDVPIRRDNKTGATAYLGN